MLRSYIQLKRSNRLWVVLVFIGLMCLLIRPTPRALPPIKALWVTRFDYQTDFDVKQIMRNAAMAGFTDVFFQVRGNATTCYPSDLEPWSDSVLINGQPPKLNLLSLAVDQAHFRGMRLHAYINVLPGWSGEAPSTDPSQLWNARPEWFMVDQTGTPMQPVKGWYTFLNPLHPEVKMHLRKLYEEIITYPIDGIHFDYIRYPYDYYLVATNQYDGLSMQERKERYATFTHDSYSRARLKEADLNLRELERQEMLRKNAISELLCFITKEDRANRGYILSAATLGNPKEATRFAGQDLKRWINEDLLDWVVQMNYSSTYFDDHLSSMKQLLKREQRAHWLVGLSAENSESVLKHQLDTVSSSGAVGVSIFSYGLLFEDHEPTEIGKALISWLASY
jgi:uncharacterized lipoprotein YddW (UPF0748 family)